MPGISLPGKTSEPRLELGLEDMGSFLLVAPPTLGAECLVWGAQQHGALSVCFSWCVTDTT